MAKQSLRARTTESKSMHEGQPFTVVVSADFAGFKQGDTLSLDRQIAEYFRAATNEGRDEEITLTDDEILLAVKNTDVTDLSVDDSDVVRTEAVEQMARNKAEPLADERSIDELIEKDPDGLLGTMRKLGQQVDAGFDGKVMAALDGKKVWDGAPLALLPELERLYGKDVLAGMPIVGTRKQGKKNKKGQSTDNVPDGYNLPTDFFSREEGGETKYYSAIKEWIDSMPHVKQLTVLKKTIKMVIDSDENLKAVTVPKDIADLMAEHREDGIKQTHTLDGIYKDVTADLTNYHTRCSRALHAWQIRHILNTEFEKTMHVGFLDGPNYGDPVLSSRRNKPIVMYGRSEIERTDESTGKVTVVQQEIPQKPISLTAFLNFKIAKAKQLAGGQPVQLKHLVEASKRGTKKTAPKPDQQGSTVTVGRIEKVQVFGDVLAASFDYMQDNDVVIRHTLQGSDAGLLSSRMVALYEMLQGMIEKDPTIKVNAKAYDQQQAAANAAKAAAKGAAAIAARDAAALIEKKQSAA